MRQRITLPRNVRRQEEKRRYTYFEDSLCLVCFFDCQVHVLRHDVTVHDAVDLLLLTHHLQNGAVNRCQEWHKHGHAAFVRSVRYRVLAHGDRLCEKRRAEEEHAQRKSRDEIIQGRHISVHELVQLWGRKNREQGLEDPESLFTEEVWVSAPSLIKVVSLHLMRGGERRAVPRGPE